MHRQAGKKALPPVWLGVPLAAARNSKYSSKTKQQHIGKRAVKGNYQYLNNDYYRPIGWIIFLKNKCHTNPPTTKAFILQKNVLPLT
jgi:hypothetical protein